MKTLTDKQKDILEFIEDFMEKQAMSPSVYEIADYFKIKTSTVFAHLRALQRKNQLSRSSKARSISLMKPRHKSKHMSFVLSIPLLGRINAGLPAESIEHKEGDVFIDTAMIGKKNTDKAFALRVQGESMRDIGIYQDDVVIVKQIEKPKSGDIVVALVNEEVTVKTIFFQKDDIIELRPANSDFSPQFYPASQVIIQGKVIGLQRKY